MKEQKIFQQLLIGGIFSIGCLTYLILPFLSYIWVESFGLELNLPLIPFFSLFFFGVVYYLSIDKIKKITQMASQSLSPMFIVFMVVSESALYLFLAYIIPIHESYAFIFN